MEKQMIAELEVECPAQDVAPRLHDALYGGKTSGSFELEVPFERLGLPAIGKFSRRARVTLGQSNLRSDGAMLVPIVWRDARSKKFPEFKGYIEILPLASDRSQVAIIGEYAPPLGPLGEIFDASVGKHIAEVTVEELLDHLRSILERGA